MRNRLIEATQWALLRALADGPCKVNDLFTRINASKTNQIVTDAFEQLLNEGAIIMRTDWRCYLRGR